LVRSQTNNIKRMKKSKRSKGEEGDEGGGGGTAPTSIPPADNETDPWSAALGTTNGGFFTTEPTNQQYPSLPRAMTNERAAKKRRRRELHAGDEALDAPVAPSLLLRSAAEMAAAAAEKKQEDEDHNVKQEKKKKKEGGGEPKKAAAAAATPPGDDDDDEEAAARLRRKRERKERRKQAKKEKRAAAVAAAAAGAGAAGDGDGANPAAAAAPPPSKKKKSKNKFKQQDEEEQEDAAAPAPPPPSKTPESNSLFSKMRARLAGGQFRQLNEALYTRPGQDALKLMSSDPSLFEAYHSGFQEQTRGWPYQPAELAAQWAAARLPKGSVLADFGCGDARLARALEDNEKKSIRVHSLDLVASAPGVIACNMADTPLETGSCDAAVFSLALMGTDYGAFLGEARRVLKRPVAAAAATKQQQTTGLLWIAEVRSRFVPEGADREDFAPFLRCLRKLGFKLERQDAASNRMFVVWELRLEAAAAAAGDEKGDGEAAKRLAARLDWPPLRACVYKKR
jgi:ribosomal RNA-processing protein 8